MISVQFERNDTYYRVQIGPECDGRGGTGRGVVGPGGLVRPIVRHEQETAIFKNGDLVEFHWWHANVGVRTWIPGTVSYMDDDEVVVVTDRGTGWAPADGTSDPSGRQVRHRSIPFEEIDWGEE